MKLVTKSLADFFTSCLNTYGTLSLGFLEMSKTVPRFRLF